MKANAVVVLVMAAACQSGESHTQTDSVYRLPTEMLQAAPDSAAPTAMQLIASEAPPTQTDVPPPFTLTASDGSGLQVTRIDARAVVQGPLAFTELHLYFRNPEARTREGTFAITLPANAAVSRFAMEIDGQFQEAEVVEKAVARRVYDDFLHRKQDPALLEKAAGNQFTAKVFPIPANADKHLVVSFSQELPGRGYVLPLRGLPEVEQVDVAIHTTALDGTVHPQVLSKSDWQPDRDFTASIPAVPAAVVAGTNVVAAVAMSGDNASAGTLPPDALTILVDTSASRALGFERYVHTVRELVETLRARYGGAMRLQVIAFDQDTESIFDGTSGGYGEAQDRALLARGAAGASDLAQAVSAMTAPHRRVLVITDGVLTAGPDLPALVASLKKLSVDRIDVALAGGIRDEQAAAAIARPGLRHAGDVFDLDRGVAAVAAGLADPVLTNVPVQIPGARWSFPSTVSALRAGKPLMVFASMAKPVRAINVYVGGDLHTLGLVPATEPLVQRAVAASEIAELEDKLARTSEANAAKAMREAIAKKSVAARVISSQTSMLVLETDADYDRYHIPRNALADILVVGPAGLEHVKRTFVAANKPAPTPEPPQIAFDDVPPPEEEDRPDDGADESGGTGTAMALEEGRAGRRDSDRAEGQYRMQRNTEDPQLAREQAIQLARNAGVLGSTALETGGSVAGLASNEDASSGFDDANLYGAAGAGPGGSGTGWGTIGTGRYGTIGRGSGTGSGYGVGGGRGGMRGRSAALPSISVGQPVAQGDLDRAIIRRYIKRNIQKLTYCYERQLLVQPALHGTVLVRFFIDASGNVTSSSAQGVDPTVADCIARVVHQIQFPRPRDGGGVQVAYPFTFRPSGGVTSVAAVPSDPQSSTAFVADPDPALDGKLEEVMVALRRFDADKALTIATEWHAEAPGDVLALIGLGEALEAKHDVVRAARIYGSIIDLFPTRADMRRFAGERLERLGKASRSLVVDTYRRAVADRPDHANGHRLLAYALVRANDYAGAFAAILAGVDQKYPSNRFLGVDRILHEDAGMLGVAYLNNGGSRETIARELEKRSIPLPAGPSTRFLMYWETDSNDVDFHIEDAHGGHAWYSHKDLEFGTGGTLYADVTTGYGPECFTIEGTPDAGPYKLSINYYSQGPMGFGMGLLQIQRFDGKRFVFEDRPYVIMTNRAFVDLGTYQ